MEHRWSWSASGLISQRIIKAVYKIKPAELIVLWRYYQAGIVNTIVGYGLFVGFVAIGCNAYFAQLIAHVLGTIFNYLTYSRYAFRGFSSDKFRFFVSYVFNYMIGLFCLMAGTKVFSSPYVAGLSAILLSSLINFFVLRRFVFRFASK